MKVLHISKKLGKFENNLTYAKPEKVLQNIEFKCFVSHRVHTSVGPPLA
jgi:hypothetical protein